jgi:hypothetical protein
MPTRGPRFVGDARDGRLRAPSERTPVGAEPFDIYTDR